MISYQKNLYELWGGIGAKEGSAHNLYSTDEFSEHQIPLKAHCVLILDIHYAKLIE